MQVLRQFFQESGGREADRRRRKSLKTLDRMARDRICLPFQFLVTTAQGHLKKANFSRKAGMHEQELHFLKKFDVLVSSSMASHPHYTENRCEKAVVEFERQLGDIRKRIQELEAERKSRRIPKSSAFKGKMAKKKAPCKAEYSQLEFLPRRERIVPENQSDNDSSCSSLRSKLAESVKVLSPRYSPRRLKRSLEAAAKGSCLEQEASLAGKEWLKLEVSGSSAGSESDDDYEEEVVPRLDISLAKKTGPKGHQIPNEADVNPRKEMKDLYKQLMGATSSGKLVHEFRQTLKALEGLQVQEKRRISVFEQKAREKAHGHREKAKARNRSTDRNDDVDFVRGFISSTREILDRDGKADKVSEHIKASDRLELSSNKRLKEKADGREQSKKVNWFERLAANAVEQSYPTMPSKEVQIEELPDGNCEQVDALVEAKIESLFSKRLDRLISGTEQALSCIRVEVESAREVGLQLKLETDSLKKANESKLEGFQQMLLKVQKDGIEVKSQVQSLRRLEESLKSDKESINKLFEMIEKDGIARRNELEVVRKEQEEICAKLLAEGENEKAMMMDKIERLSTLYIGGLEDVRAEVANLKATPESTGRAETLLAEMRLRRKKSIHLESVMKNAVEGALKLQEKYSLELEKAKDNWNWALNLQIGEAKSVLGELTEQSHALCAKLGSFEGHSVLLGRIQSIEGEVMQLMATSKSPSSDGTIYDSIEKHKEVVQKEIYRLDEQMQEALKKLEGAVNNLDHEKSVCIRADLEDKVREVTKSRSVILEKITEMGKKVRKLEGAQLNLVRSVEELRTSTSDLELSASTWLPKYATAANLLKDMDTRLGVAENMIRGRTKGEDEINLQTKFENLEDRVEHVASETMSEIRMLDSKVEQCKAGVQSALEGAALAESKCGVLGTEIVKVFRMFAARHGKLSELNGVPRPDVKEKSHVGCKSCKKASTEHSDAGQSASRKASRTEDHHKHGKQAAQDIEASADAEKRARRISTGRPSFIHSYAETLYETGKINSSREIGEHYASDDDKQLSPVSRFSKQMKEKALKSCQRTNIRLEGGKVHVNVHH